ncbi:MAG: ClbS/DfsB family four-helix bundle protein [Candidatus Hodarchaeales archaeon]
MNTKGELIELLRNKRKELESILDGLSEVQKLKPGAHDEWSIKDIIAHIMVWEQRGLEWIKVIIKGRDPSIPLKGYTWRDFDHLNEEIYQKYKDYPLDNILFESKKSFENLMNTVQSFPDETLEKTFYSTGSRQQKFLGKELIFWRYLHYKKHIQQIEKWLEKE